MGLQESAAIPFLFKPPFDAPGEAISIDTASGDLTKIHGLLFHLPAHAGEHSRISDVEVLCQTSMCRAAEYGPVLENDVAFAVAISPLGAPHQFSAAPFDFVAC